MTAMQGIEIGRRVRVTQTVQWGRHEDRTVVEGVVRRMGRQKTGSWVAHEADDKLSIDRVELEREDGELVVCNLDRFSSVELMG